MDGEVSLWETLKLHLNFGARTVPVLDVLRGELRLEGGGLFETSDAKRKAFTRVVYCKFCVATYEA
ncbi:MAG: hypothetical protein R3C59_16175 [Planctomycetaceae bacterium]